MRTTGLLWLDAQGEMVRASDVVCRALELDQPPTSEHPVNLRALLHPDVVDSVLRSQLADSTSEHRAQSHNGHWYLLRPAAQTPSPHGQDRSALCVEMTDVTLLVCEIEKAQEGQQLYRSFIDRAHSIAYRAALDDRPYFFHGAVEALTGYSSEAFARGDPRWNDIVIDEDRPRREQTRADLLEGKFGSTETEYRIMRRDEQQRWVRELAQAIVDDQGQIRWLQGTIVDISDRKWAELQAHEAQEHFRLAFETSPDAIGINQLSDGTYIDVNPAWLELAGYSRDQVLGRTDIEINIWMHNEQRAQIVAELKKNGVATNIEVAFRHRLGHPVWCLTSAALLRIGGRSCVLTQGREIGKLKEAQQKLRESEERYRHLAENVTELISRHDLQGHYLYASLSCEHLLGCSPAHLIGKHPADLALESTGDEVRQTFVRCVEQRRVLTCQYPARRKNGDPIWLETSFRALRDGQGQVYEVLCVSRDISDRRAAEEQRQQLEKKVQQAQKLESLGIMAGGIAHDFNNLLVGILGNLDLARLSLEQGEDLEQLLHDTERAAQQATDLTQQMLAYSGHGTFDVKLIDLSQAIDEMRHLLEVASARRRQPLKYELAEGLPRVHADLTQVRQIVINLVSNAGEALGQSSGQIVISTGQAVREETRGVYLRVADNGPGMPSSIVKRIFDPFFSTKFTGRGLGLAAVQGIVRSHKGHIDVGSQPGQGSVFTVWFPAADRSHEGDIDAPKDAPRDFVGSGRVLLVDDDPVVIEVGERMLSRIGFEVLCAHSGREALRLLRQQKTPVRCAVVDLTMPELDGVATIQALRQQQANLPVLLSSGFSRQDAQAQLGDLRDLAFVQKPYRTRTLAQKLSALLRDDGAG